MLLRVDQYLQINCKTQETLTDVSESRGSVKLERAEVVKLWSPLKEGQESIREDRCYCVLLAAVIVLYFLPSFIFI